MTAPQTPLEPRSRFYDGRVYSWTAERALVGLHRRLARRVPEGARVLDACCGTGAMTAQLSGRCSEVLGVDISPRAIAYAERRRAAQNLDNVRFEVRDAGHLPHIADAHFDWVMVVLALHEMPAERRLPVLVELARVGRRVLVIDHAAPMPWNLAGIRTRLIEAAAGLEHFGGFRDFLRRDGLGPLLGQADLHVEEHKTLDSGAMTLAIARR